jgi:endonuclease/exonuclease/phosphatase family metal-dependent hydrolase
MTLPHKNSSIGTPFKRRGGLWSLGWHTGDDWLTATGEKAYAMGDGRVISTSYNRSYGNNVIVETFVAGIGRVRWSENHLSKVSVKTGQTVTAGQVVGLTGATGHVTGPHDHVEARVSPFTFTPAAFIDPQVMYDWKPKSVTRPVWATRRPKGKPAKAYRAVSFNVGGMNEQGAKTIGKRLPKIARDLARVKPDVIGLQELPNAWVDDMDHLMVGWSYRRVCGSDGRYIYRHEDVDRVAHGVFDLKPRYQDDDKQAAWAVLRINGRLEVVVCGHLESDNPANAERVGQALDMLRQAHAVATRHGLSKSRIAYLVDTNSDNQVRVDAFNEKNYVDAAETAWKRSYVSRSTFVGWAAQVREGARIDGIYVHRTRAVLYYTTRVKSAGLSDHLMIVADIGVLA